MIIRKEHPRDIERISQILYAAFDGHPQHDPGAAPFEHLIVERLRAGNALSLSLTAEVGSVLVGHIAFSTAKVGKGESGWFLLGPVGVLPERQGRGVGGALIREGRRLLEEGSAKGIVLVGDPGFYARFGFRNFPGLSWEGVPEQYVLGLAFGSALPEGGIVAHEAFYGVK